MHTQLLHLAVRFEQRLREVGRQDREAGLTTTEVAVLTFILVGLAIAVGAFIVNYTSQTVNNIEQAPVPQIGGG